MTWTTCGASTLKKTANINLRLNMEIMRTTSQLSTTIVTIVKLPVPGNKQGDLMHPHNKSRHDLGYEPLLNSRKEN